MNTPGFKAGGIHSAALRLLFDKYVSNISEIIKYTGMEKFKTIDVWVNTGLIAAAVLFGLNCADGKFIIGYFVVGGWQVISMFIHAVNGWFCAKDSARRIYHNMVIVILVIVPLSFVFYPISFLLLMALLFVSPFMAVYYTALCYNEVKTINQRPLAFLK